MLHDGSGVKLARTIMRMPGADKWNKDALVKVGCTPYDLHQLREPEVVFRETTGEKVENPEQLISMVRQVYIKPKDIQRYGFVRVVGRAAHLYQCILVPLFCSRHTHYGPGKLHLAPIVEHALPSLLSMLMKMPA